MTNIPLITLAPDAYLKRICCLARLSQVGNYERQIVITNQPLVSIGVPTFNRPDKLKVALQCLTRQTYRNLEIIVSDNCSTKVEVAQIMHEIMRHESRIKYIRQEKNIGPSANYEFLVKEANGKYFTWAADDDLCTSNFIEKLVESMESHSDLALCGCDVQSIDANENLLEVNLLNSIRLSEDWRKTRRLFFRYPTSNVFFSIYGLYRTDRLRQCSLESMIGWKGFLTNGEVPFLAQLTTFGRIASIPEVLKIYRRHPDSAYYKELEEHSKFDTFMLRMVIRLKLGKLAMSGDNPLPVKLSLLNAMLTSYISGMQILTKVVTILGRVTRKIRAYADKLPHLWR